MTDQPKQSRRDLVLALGAAAVAAATIPPALAARRPIGLRSVALRNVHTGEHLNTVYWAEGRYVPDAMRRINWVLRDHHTDEVRRIHPDLLDLLAKLQAKLRTREPFQVVSAYRSPTTNAMLATMTDGVAAAQPAHAGHGRRHPASDRSLAKVQHRGAKPGIGRRRLLPALGFHPCRCRTS